MHHKILYIDDDIVDGQVFTRIFGEIYPTIYLTSGFQALDLIGRDHFSLIIVDIHMPVMNGIEAVKKIKLHPNFNLCPIFFLTSDESDFTREMGLLSEVDDYLTKSMKEYEIKLRIRNHINKFRALTITSEEITFGTITVKPRSIEIFVKGHRLNLTLIEYKIIHFLVCNSGTCGEKTHLINHVWNGEHVLSATLNSHITNIRKKLDPYGIEILGGRDQKFKISFKDAKTPPTT